MATSVIPAADWAAAISLRRTGLDIEAVMRTLLARAAAGQRRAIGFPAATDIDYRQVEGVFGTLYNNVGDAFASTPLGDAHTVDLEREVIHWLADLFGLAPDDRWGYVTSGGTEANLAALRIARQRHPDALVYFSHAAHYSIAKINQILGIVHADAVLIDDDKRGEMNYQHLEHLVERHRNRPAIVVATAGTTMYEAIDDTSRIEAILRGYGVQQRHIHVDAALAGVPLALDGVLRLGPGSPVDSVATSGHKFFGTPIPCGVVIMADSVRMDRGDHVEYTSTIDTTISGSRLGQAAVLLWYAIAAYGVNGHFERALAARKVAAYAVDRLTAIGWPAWRHDHAFTVVLDTPPQRLLERGWILSTKGQQSHIIAMPGVTMDVIDEFVAELAEVAAEIRPTARAHGAYPGQHRRIAMGDPLLQD